MAKTDTLIQQQKLYPHQALNRLLCASCNDGAHRHCELYACQCPCRGERKPRIRVKRDRNGLSAEERAAQSDFPFDACEPFEISAEPMTTTGRSRSDGDTANLGSDYERERRLLDYLDRGRKLQDELDYLYWKREGWKVAPDI